MQNPEHGCGMDVMKNKNKKSGTNDVLFLMCFYFNFIIFSGDGQSLPTVWLKQTQQW